MSEPAPISVATPASKDEQMLAAARSLVESLEQGQTDNVEQQIGELTRLRESEIFQEMGRLTRELHDAITGVQSDDQLARIASEEMPEARERLDYVITMTENAANKTMTLVEDSLPISDNITERAGQLQAAWHRFTSRELTPDEFRELSREVEVFFEDVSQNTSQLRSNLSEVLMAQDYQDLTGQVIRRVTGMVQQVEDNLVQLIKSTGGQVTELAPASGPDVEAEGPQLHAETRDDVVSGQDDVDDLLSSLGF